AGALGLETPAAPAPPAMDEPKAEHTGEPQAEALEELARETPPPSEPPRRHAEPPRGNRELPPRAFERPGREEHRPRHERAPREERPRRQERPRHEPRMPPEEPPSSLGEIFGPKSD